MVTLSKLGKHYKNPNSYILIYLLWHTFKLYERMIMNRVKGRVERKLIPHLDGFGPSKKLHTTGIKLVSIYQGRLWEQMSNRGGFRKSIHSI